VKRRHLPIPIALLLLAFWLVSCNIADTGEDIIDTGKEVADFMDEARRKLEPLAEKLAQDGLDMGKYVLKLAQCMAGGDSVAECEKQVRQDAYDECREDHDKSYCKDRYGR
jgi:predicted small secreted protein